MALNISAYDIQNYPDNGKTLTVDLKSVIPTGSSGDERFVLSTDTSATASGSAVIQEAFASSIVVGWAMSSTRVSGPFSITESNKNMKVAIDEGIGSAITITVATSDSTQSGDSIAVSIEYQIRRSTVVGGAKAGNLAYLNAKCVYKNGRFIILSGSLSSSLTGSNRSSVRVAVGDTADVAVTLGFDVPIESEALAGQAITETYVTSIVSSSTTVPVNTVSGFSAGDCIALKTPGGTTYYRYLDSVGAPNLVVNTAVSVAANTMVQVLRMQDPVMGPSSYYKDVDSVMRHTIEKIVRQINFAA